MQQNKRKSLILKGQTKALAAELEQEKAREISLAEHIAPLRAALSSVGGLRVRPLYGYTGKAIDELSFRKGITVIETFDDNWGEGILKSQIGGILKEREGTFPPSLVEIITENLIASGPLTKANDKSTTGSTLSLYKALFDFVDRDPYEYLLFRKGDIITAIESPSVEEGWGKGFLKNCIGNFPMNYVEKVTGTAGIVPRVRAGSDFVGINRHELTFREGDIIPILESPSTVSVNWAVGFLEGRPGLFPLKHVEEMDDDNEEDTSAEEVSRVRAAYSFVGQDDSELSFQEGDVIAVLDSADKNWWKGVLKGRTGLFPLNHVQKLGNKQLRFEATPDVRVVSRWIQPGDVARPPPRPARRRR